MNYIAKVYANLEGYKVIRRVVHRALYRGFAWGLFFAGIAVVGTEARLDPNELRMIVADRDSEIADLKLDIEDLTAPYLLAHTAVVTCNTRMNDEIGMIIEEFTYDQN